jgi:hypothetical protein
MLLARVTLMLELRGAFDYQQGYAVPVQNLRFLSETAACRLLSHIILTNNSQRVSRAPTHKLVIAFRSQFKETPHSRRHPQLRNLQ